MTEPQRFTVRHVSIYRYAEPVRFGEHRMMFRPRASHDLRLVTDRLVITPTPSKLHWLHDVFDNSVAVASFEGQAKELRFDSEVTLEHFEAPLPDYALEPYAMNWPFAYTNEEASDLVNARSRQYPDNDVDEWARRFIPLPGTVATRAKKSAGGGTMAMLRAMTADIRNTFSYTRRTEKGVNRPGETLRSRSGSCRDFAVLMMDAVRSLGLAARFVSGYIFVPEHDVTQGGGSTHAWLQIFLPGAGWVDFDPTNSIIGNRHLIRV
ncbi:MAG TPA: transglutaminase family protein, partial [Paraburkholderia sp.]|nr:transglutaminase family protein [Paraburkholderia sp.]